MAKIVSVPSPWLNLEFSVKSGGIGEKWRRFGMWHMNQNKTRNKNPIRAKMRAKMVGGMKNEEK